MRRSLLIESVAVPHSSGSTAILQVRPGAVRNQSMRALARIRDLLGHDLSELVST